MNFFLTLAFLFFIGSTVGWLIELVFRRFFSAHKWINPGFLVGPYLPIYGFGVVGLFLMSQININTGNEVLTIVVKLLLMAVIMTIIEYIAGIIFIKGMHIKLWDYSNRWGNVQGIICPLFSFLWTLVGCFYYFFINPYILESLAWLASNLSFSFVIGFFYGVFFIDVACSLKLSARISKFAKDNEIVVRYEHLKYSIRERLEETKERISFILPFKSSESIKDSILRYIERYKNEKK